MDMPMSAQQVPGNRPRWGTPGTSIQAQKFEIGPDTNVQNRHWHVQKSWMCKMGIQCAKWGQDVRPAHLHPMLRALHANTFTPKYRMTMYLLCSHSSHDIGRVSCKYVHSKIQNDHVFVMLSFRAGASKDIGRVSCKCIHWKIQNVHVCFMKCRYSHSVQGPPKTFAVRPPSTHSVCRHTS